MTPVEFHQNVLHPALHEIAQFAPQMHRNRSLDVLMTAIAGQESNWTDRVQVPSGAAHGLFQCQENDVADIVANPASAEIFKAGLEFFKISGATAREVFMMLADEKADALAVFVARCNLWCDPRPIPAWDDEQGLYRYYLDTWRPGAPSATRWARAYGQALEAVPVS